MKFNCAKTYPSPISSFQLLKPSMLEKVWPQVRAMTNLTPAELIILEYAEYPRMECNIFGV